MTVRFGFVVSLGVTLFGGACASSGSIDRNFPSASELASIASRPPPAALLDRGERDVREWRMVGELPTTLAGARIEPVDELDEVLLAALAGKERNVATVGMKCIATQVAAFVLEHDTFPGERVRRFITGRCGATAVNVQANSVSAEVAADWDGKLPEEWGENLEELAGGLTGEGFREVGMAMAHKDKKLVIIGVSAERVVEMETRPLSPDTSGSVALRGTLLKSSQRLAAWVTQGKYKAVRCQMVFGLDLPSFGFSCPVDTADSIARIDVISFQPDAVLGDLALSLVVLPDGGTGELYQRTTYADAVPLGGGDPDKALFALLNRVRADAGLEPVALDGKQSRFAKKVAPHFFGSLVDNDRKLADTLTLGMMAGWDVEGPVREGTLSWGILQDSTDLSELLAIALESPGSRAALLADETDRVAVGTAVSHDPPAVVSLFGSYELFTPTDHRAAAEAFIARLTTARESIGRLEAVELKKTKDLSLDLAKQIETEGKDPGGALNQLMRAAADKYNKSVKGHLLAVTDLENVQLPSELVNGHYAHVAVTIAYTRPDGAAWGNYVVLIAAVQSQPPTTASLADAPRVASAR